MKHIVSAILLVSIVGITSADMISPFDAFTVNSTGLDTLTYGGTTYTTAQLITGTTTRFYAQDDGAGGDSGVRIALSPDDGVTAMPGDMYTMPGSSNIKIADPGMDADDFEWADSHMSSIDGLPYQETIFGTPTDTIFVFERGGNDSGMIYGITASSVGTGITLDKSIHYGNIGTNVAGQNYDSAYVVTFDAAVDGIRIAAPGHDALTVATIPEPASMILLGLGGVALLRRRKA